MDEKAWLQCGDVFRMIEWCHQTVERRVDRAIYLQQDRHPVSQNKLRLLCAAVSGARLTYPVNPIPWLAEYRTGLHSPGCSPAVVAVKLGRVADFFRNIVGNPFHQPAVVRVSCNPCGGRGGWEDPEEGQFVSHLDCNGKGWLPAAWLTPMVVGIARDIAENERWDLMSVLADALDDAGCPDEGMVRHLRGWGPCPGCCGATKKRTATGGGYTVEKCGTCDGAGWVRLKVPHVLGDWVVDLLLGDC